MTIATPTGAGDSIAASDRPSIPGAPSGPWAGGFPVGPGAWQAWRGVLRDRAAIVRASLAACTLCEKRCGVDRREGPDGRPIGRAPCGLGERSYSFKRHISFAEEEALLPSYMVYLAGCNFRCGFCVQAPECFDPRRGPLVEPEELARECAAMVDRGARSLNLLGGEPSIHLHTVLEMVASADGPLPWVMNSNFYMTPVVLEMLEGAVAWYLADFKFGSDACAKRIAGVDRYVEVVTRNLRLAHEQCRRTGARLIVRHLDMPGHEACCKGPVLEWMQREMPSVALSVMDSYVPAWRSERFVELSRLGRLGVGVGKGVGVGVGVGAAGVGLTVAGQPMKEHA